MSIVIAIHAFRKVKKNAEFSKFKNKIGGVTREKGNGETKRALVK